MGERRGWDESDVMLMAQINAEKFERMFEALSGDEVRQSIETIRQLARSHRPEAAKIDEVTTEALKCIAAKSPLRARKIGKFIDLNDDQKAEC